MTSDSASTSYCTPAEMLMLFDTRFLGDLVFDDGTRATEAQLLASTKLQFILDAASGELESACCVGGRYTAADLAALTGVTRSRLSELVAWLAIGKLMGRRNPSVEKYPQIADAREDLQMLREGVRIFTTVEAQEADEPALVQSTGFNVRPLPSSYCRAGRFFGRRSAYMPNCNNGGTCGGSGGGL